MTQVLLLSTYDLGHQPFGLASPTAWFKKAGAQVRCLDLAVQPLDAALVQEARFIAIYLPMHTATRLAAAAIPRIKAINPQAHLVCYGLYAPVNEKFLRQLGVDSILGGEFEAGLVALWQQHNHGAGEANDVNYGQPTVSLDRQSFHVPDRELLPSLNDYAQLTLPDGRNRLVGYTESTRGCKHLCRHCPIVPVYNGRFRVVQPEVVLADIRQQADAGAQHITFGDPDFFNGPGHALRIINALHDEHPDLTYDVTIKIEHLLKYSHQLSALRETGCLFVTSAVEAVDDSILDHLDKGHTRADFIYASELLRSHQLVMHPTFVAFTPWTTPDGYLALLRDIRDLNLVANVSPIQYAIRLLIPAGSRLLELPSIHEIVGEFDRAALCYPWQHPNPKMDQLYRTVYGLVAGHQNSGEGRDLLFKQIWRAVLVHFPELSTLDAQATAWDLASKPVPRLSESWY
jgi:radical SAM superfamily enzyme YgiQ (UPF0313 family)